jgi:cytidyltransferase-like protein
MNYGDKIIQLKDVSSFIDKKRLQQIVLVGGCFDIFHYGHLFFLARAKEKGEHLMVLLETNAFITRVKKKEPVHSQQQRAEILASLVQVDSVVLLPELSHPDSDYRQIVETIQPAVIAVTQGDRQLAHKQEMAQAVNASLFTVEHLSSFSSSHLITYASVFRD